jgi:hypothetical protein
MVGSFLLKGLLDRLPMPSRRYGRRGGQAENGKERLSFFGLPSEKSNGLFAVFRWTARSGRTVARE